MKSLRLRLIAAIVAIAAITTICVLRHADDANANEQQALLSQAIATSARPDSLRALLARTPEEWRDEMGYLITYMLPADRDTMSLALLEENVRYAQQAMETYEWTRELPREVYLTHVLPYHVVDEVRDAWRKELHETFAPVVDTCATMMEAVTAVGRIIPALTGVNYDTRREKTNQSPRESMRQGMASCTGLAILLVDAYRAVGIPARFVGTASWHDDRGNHSWTEVWVDGEWRVTEYYLPSQLDHLWFMSDAAKADPNDRRYAIYATRFGPAPDWFPMVWCGDDSTQVADLPQCIGAENVTQHYIDLAQEQHDKHLEDDTHTYLRIAGYRSRDAMSHSTDRVVMGVDVFCGTEQMGGGLTAGPLRDMNDYLTMLLPKHTTYELRYYDANGRLHTQQVCLGDEPLTVAVFLNSEL